MGVCSLRGWILEEGVCSVRIISNVGKMEGEGDISSGEYRRLLEVGLGFGLWSRMICWLAEINSRTFALSMCSLELYLLAPYSLLRAACFDGLHWAEDPQRRGRIVPVYCAGCLLPNCAAGPKSTSDGYTTTPLPLLPSPGVSAGLKRC